MHHSFALPSTFDPRDYLTTPKLLGRVDDAKYFVSLILTKMAQRKADGNEHRDVIRLKAEYLKNIMHQIDYAAVIDALVNGGAVNQFPYCPGNYSFGYELSEQFARDEHVRILATNRRLIRRLDKFHAEKAEERRRSMQPVHFALETLQHRLRIDGAMARGILATMPESNRFDVQGILVRDIEEGRYRCNVGTYGRFSNNITNLKRELRTALRVDKEPLSNVDLSCAQPALIGRLIQQHNQQRKRKNKGEETKADMILVCDPHPYDSRFDGPDVDEYCSLTQRGEFYDAMVSELSKKRIDREAVKKKFLQDVVAKQKANDRGDEYPSLFEDAFRKKFPTVYAFIRHFNRDGREHENLIRRLQQEESKLVIESVCTDLVTRHPNTFFITLHDAIYTTDRHIPKVEAAFKRAFDASGYPLRMKTCRSSAVQALTSTGNAMTREESQLVLHATSKL